MELKEFEKQLGEKLTAHADEMKGILGEYQKTTMQMVEEKVKQGSADPETKEKLGRIEKRIDEMEGRLGAPDGGRQQQNAWKSVGEHVTDSKEYKEWKDSQFRRMPSRILIDGPIFRDLKATTTTGTTGSSGTPGVIPFQRLDILDPLARIKLTIRDLLTVRPVGGLNVDWLRQATRTNAASPQVEGELKVESTYTWEAVSTSVKTIAHYFQVSTQALADVPWLRGEIDGELMFGLKLKEESELLSGDGLGSHLSGLIPNSTAYNTTLNVSGDTKLDKLRHAIYQARLALYPVDGIVLNPKDLHDIELIKTEEGGANKGVYIVGDPKGSDSTIPMIWGKPVIESDAIASGKFLAGAFGFGAILFDRMAAQVDISYEHGTNFLENEATIRCEERVGLGIRKSLAFVYGSI